MPVQQQMSSFAKKLGARVAQANAEHANKPVDTGNRRLPAGIREGVARLSTMYTKEYEKGKSPSGEKAPGETEDTFFRASAIVVGHVENGVLSESFKGEKIAGQVTSQMVPLCDIPAKGQRKAKSFSENWYEFQNIFKLLGVPPCPETPQTDPTGQRTEAYFMAAMKMLTDPNRAKTNPVLISFSTRGWTPAATAQNPKPDEMVFETWHGLWNGQLTVDPAGGVREQPPSTPGTHYSGPPTADADGMPPGPPPTPAPTTTTAAAPPSQPLHTPPSPQEPEDKADLVASLVEVAMNDPEGATEEGASASSQLEEMAWAAGWTKDQTANAADWAAVGDMALNPPQETSHTTTAASTSNGVVVGSKWLFAKRTKDGVKLKDGKGKEFPPQEVVVAGINESDRTCTLKTAKDGKDVVDIRTKAPVAVKFEWLEPIK